MGLTVQVVSPHELEPLHIQLWSAHQEADPALASPFFSPEFTLAVAAVRSDVQVGVIECDGAVSGFFPFQRGRLPVAMPVGGDRSNYHGVIADGACAWTADALLRGCGLRAWDFHHLIVGQRQFAPFHARFQESPILDLSDGFEVYAQRREGGGSRVIRKLRQQERRMERELGSLRLEPHVPAIEALRTMMRWKSHQYRDTGKEDRFASRWNVDLLERVHACQAPGFAGMLPVLYAGDELVAVAMCLRSRHVLHYWFPAYRTDLASFSPGMLLLLKLAEKAQSLGLSTIDLGKGRAPYKDRLASDAIVVAEGTAAVPSLFSCVKSARNTIAARIRESRLETPVRAVARRLRG